MVRQGVDMEKPGFVTIDLPQETAGRPVTRDGKTRLGKAPTWRNRGSAPSICPRNNSSARRQGQENSRLSRDL